MAYFARKYLALSILLFWNTKFLHCQQGEDLINFYESHERAKRQVPPGMGGESCLQIYSVPRKSVACEPTEEVKNALTDLREKIDENKAAHEQLTVRVEELDPDKPRELPQEVKDRLDTIDEVKQTQAGHAEYLKRLDSDIGHITGKIYNKLQNARKNPIILHCSIQRRCSYISDCFIQLC